MINENMRINIITAFPKIFDSFFSESIISRAQKKELLSINILNLRDFTYDNHQTIDMRPFGGGPGMILMVEPIYKALLSIYADAVDDVEKFRNRDSNKIVLTSPKGRKYNQTIAMDYSKLDTLTIICGHYEGVDSRVSENFVDEEVSIGDFILSGGEAATIVIVDSITRLLPGSLGNPNSLMHETDQQKGIHEYSQYTRPQKFITKDKKTLSVPKILLSGNHKEIEKWRNFDSAKASN